MAAKAKTTQLPASLAGIDVAGDDLIRSIVEIVLNEMLEVQFTEQVGAAPYERSPERLGYRAGYYRRSLVTRVGKIILRVPRDRAGIFSTEIFERYQRSEKALALAIAEMYIQGVSTRRVREIAEELFGEDISASTVSRLNERLDEKLSAFSTRRLEESYPYVFVDARYEKVRENGLVQSRAVLVAVGVNLDGRREILGIDLANRESKTSWRDFLVSLKERGLTGVQLVVSDAHEGLRRAIEETFPQALWQRCYVHLLRNAADHLDRKADAEALTELRWVYDRANVAEATKDISAWIERWSKKAPRLVGWVEANIYESLSFYRFPVAHRKHIKSTNMVERLNEEIKRRTLVVRIFPNQESALRLIRSLGIEMHEDWIEEHRYLNMEELQSGSKPVSEALSEKAS